MNILHPDQIKYIESFRSQTDPLLSKMKKYARENNIPILEELSVEFLEQLVYMYSPKMLLEIGTAIGYSTIRVAKILQNRSKIDTIELSKQNIFLAKKFIDEAKLSSVISIIEGDAHNIMAGINKEYDFIFLDADKEDYSTLFDLAMKILKINGIIVVDNLLWKGFAASSQVPKEYKKSTEFIRKFNAKFLTHPKLISSLLPIGDGLGLGIKIR